MKKGLLIYPNNKDRFNIGDYVQSIAAKQFTGEPDILIDRESLNKYSGDNIKMILNGWFMHNPKNWPPSEKIKPLFVAFHINKLAEKELLSSESLKYLKFHEPIGCRDTYTCDNLRRNGINAYFSGCLTLTLGQTYQKKETTYELIYFTDVDFHLKSSLKFKLKCIFLLLYKFNLIRKIRNRKKDFKINSSIVQNTAFYATYRMIFKDEVFLKAHYVCQEIENVFSSEKEKFEYADKLLRNYLNAQYVVTSRIHCALPCLAMGVPVLFVHPKEAGEVHNCRFGGLLELFNTIEISEDRLDCDIVTDEKLGVNSHFFNKPNFKELANSLISKCKHFCN